jgi:hypothetical protein
MPIIRRYDVDGHRVEVTRERRELPSIYHVHLAGERVPGTIEKTVGGTFHAVDGHGRRVGHALSLREAVKHLFRAAPLDG